MRYYGVTGVRACALPIFDQSTVPPQQVQHAFDRRGFSGAVSSEESITTSGLYGQIQPFDCVRSTVGSVKVLDLYNWRFFVHYRNFLSN